MNFQILNLNRIESGKRKGFLKESLPLGRISVVAQLTLVELARLAHPTVTEVGLAYHSHAVRPATQSTHSATLEHGERGMGTRSSAVRALGAHNAVQATTGRQ
jgi:hypothetical protein